MRRCFPVILILLATAAAAVGQTTQASDPADEFATFGVKASIPHEWKRLPEDGPETMAKWSVPGAAAITVSVTLETARGRVARTFATELAAKTGGEAREEASGIGDEPATRIVWNQASPPPAAGAPPSNTAPVHREVLVVVHNQYLYQIAASGPAAEGDIAAALDDLRRGFGFCEVLRPAQCSNLRDEPVTVLSKLTVRPVATIRPRPAPGFAQGKAMEMQIFNYRSGRADLILTVEVDQRKANQNLEQLGQTLLKQMSLKDDPDHPIKWKKLDGPTPRIISTSFNGARSGTRGVPLRFSLVELSEREVALFGFVFPTTDDLDRQAYEDSTEAMMQTVQAAPR